MSKQKLVLYKTKGRIAYIMLNRPESMNAINPDMMVALDEAVDQYTADDQLWCVVLTGAGDNFSAGGDIGWVRQKQVETGEALPTKPTKEGYFRALRECPKPVISAIQGYCLAGGMTMGILLSDIHIAAENARFGAPEGRWSIAPPYRIPTTWYTTLSNALYLVLTGRLITAEEALRMGIVSEVVPLENLNSRATQLAQMVCENAPIHARAHKEYLYRFMEVPGAFGDELAKLVFQKVFDSEDAREGARAFVEKREPKWKNK